MRSLWSERSKNKHQKQISSMLKNKLAINELDQQIEALAVRLKI